MKTCSPESTWLRQQEKGDTKLQTVDINAIYLKRIKE